MTPYAFSINKLLCWAKVVQMLGLARRVLSQNKNQGVPIATPRMLGALNMEHNIGTQVTKMQIWNKTPSQ